MGRSLEISFGDFSTSGFAAGSGAGGCYAPLGGAARPSAVDLALLMAPILLARIWRVGGFLRPVRTFRGLHARKYSREQT